MKRDDFDGNSVAESQYHADADRAARIFAIHEPQVIEEIVDDIMNARKVGHWRLADLLENEGQSEISASLELAELKARICISSNDDLHAFRDDLWFRAEAEVRRWIQTDSGQAIIADRVWEADGGES